MSTTTTTTTTTVASMKSFTSPIRSSSIGGGCGHFGLNLPQHRLGAAALQTVDLEATMQKLEFEVKFARDELTAEYDDIIADIQDGGNDDFTRKLKKATVLVDIRDEEKARCM